MKRFKALFIALLLSVKLPFAQNSDFIEQYNKVAFELYKIYVKGNMNQVISPFFVLQNFAPIYLASAGRTKAELSFFFGFNRDKQKFLDNYEKFSYLFEKNNNLSTRIDEFTGVFVEDSLKPKVLPQYLDQLKKLKLDTLIFIDFTQNPQDIMLSLNKQIKHSGINLLPEPIEQPPKSLKGGVMLASSVFFTGNWEKNFEWTYLSPFYLDQYGRHTKSLLYMTVSGYFKYVQGPDYQVVEIPYEDNKLSLMIILPNEGVDLHKLQQNITYGDYSLLAKGLVLQRIRLFLPILTINSVFSLKDSLKTRMPSLFRRGANLTKMVRKIIWVDNVYQGVRFKIEAENELPFKRFIDFQKEQTLNKILFINHPFIFFVKDNQTNAILFIGHVYKPI